MAFKQMENIGNFLDACSQYGVAKNDTFQTVDLYEGKNIPQVMAGLEALGRKAKSKNLFGIGAKESTRNERDFTEQQLKAGQHIIGLQMGTNKGANQSGQNFGKTRQIIDWKEYDFLNQCLEVSFFWSHSQNNECISRF